MTLRRAPLWKRVVFIFVAAFLALALLICVLLIWPNRIDFFYDDAHVANIDSLKNDVWQWYDMDKYVPVAIRRMERTTSHPLWGKRYDQYIFYEVRPLDPAPFLKMWDKLEPYTSDPLKESLLGDLIQSRDKPFFPAWWTPQKQIHDYKIEGFRRDVFLIRDGNHILILFIGGYFQTLWVHS